MADSRTYHAVSLDIINRWVYPIVPEYQFGGSVGKRAQGHMTHHKFNVYKEDGVKIARTSNVCDSAVMGKGSVVKDNVIISKSVIGPYCTIHNGCQISGSHLWGGRRTQYLA